VVSVIIARRAFVGSDVAAGPTTLFDEFAELGYDRFGGGGPHWHWLILMDPE